MRILQLHCDHIEYTPTKKEIKSAEDIADPQTTRLEELVVAFVAIEDGMISQWHKMPYLRLKHPWKK